MLKSTHEYCLYLRTTRDTFQRKFDPMIIDQLILFRTQHLDRILECGDRMHFCCGQRGIPFCDKVFSTQYGRSKLFQFLRTRYPVGAKTSGIWWVASLPRNGDRTIAVEVSKGGWTRSTPKAFVEISHVIYATSYTLEIRTIAAKSQSEIKLWCAHPQN